MATRGQGFKGNDSNSIKNGRSSESGGVTPPRRVRVEVEGIRHCRAVGQEKALADELGHLAAAEVLVGVPVRETVKEVEIVAADEGVELEGIDDAGGHQGADPCAPWPASNRLRRGGEEILAEFGDGAVGMRLDAGRPSAIKDVQHPLHLGDALALHPVRALRPGPSAPRGADAKLCPHAGRVQCTRHWAYLALFLMAASSTERKSSCVGSLRRLVSLFADV